MSASLAVIELERENARLVERLRLTCQALVAEFGAAGPCDAEQAAERGILAHRALRTEIVTLRAALEKYGKHEKGCNAYPRFSQWPCTCGLDAAKEAP